MLNNQSVLHQGSLSVTADDAEWEKKINNIYLTDVSLSLLLRVFH